MNRASAPAGDRPQEKPRPGFLTACAILLTLGTGVADVTSFTRLGGVFTSVMTGNLVLLGLAVARTSAGLAVHTTVSFAGYVAGTALGVRITGRGEARGSAGGPGSGPGSGRAWPAHVTAALVTELVLMALFTAGWEISGASPAGSAQLLLLAAAAAAMGTQTAAVRSLGLAEISTTYLTGTLAGVITALVTPDRSARRRARVGLRRPGALLALAAGAGLGGLLIATAATVLPVVQLAVLIAVIAIGARNSRTRPREVRRGRPAAG